MYGDQDPRNNRQPPPPPPFAPPGAPGPYQQPYGGPPYGPPPPGPPRGPWIAVGVAAVLAVVLIVVLVTTSGGKDGKPVAFKDPGGAPSLPMPTFTMPSIGMPTFPSFPGGSGLPPGPTGRGTAPGGGAPSASPSASPTSNDWDRAADDHRPFTAKEWFPDDLGDFSIQKRPYVQLAQDERPCTAAEDGLRRMFTDNCVGVVRSLWTEPTHTYVGALSVVSLSTKADVVSIGNRLSAGQSNGDYVAFIPPPPGSGVKFSNQSRTWVGTSTTGHYMIVIEIARSDGRDAGDAGTKQMWDDLYLVAVDHVNAQMWG
ncbi:hypothetical protein [Yinghuangia seranimata]|uniref:hypothetical protein n=1 Tax=Yinghuangia seranimata TaxID=408067 RepID=UPI00248A91C9|nr:hypothetical protein [Yinghuangia seranimata]MDI2127210.1 hypothetical protein [Yinghuangia seranimata]